MYIDFDNLKFFTPWRRRSILLLIDISILNFSIWLSFWLRLGNEGNTRLLECVWLFPSLIICGTLTYAFTGHYRGLTRHLKSKALYQIIGRNFLIVLLVSSVGIMFQFTMPPRSSWILLWILLSVLIGGLRFVLRDALIKNRQRVNSKNKSRENLVIYGAGTAGAKLASMIKTEGKANVIFFVDDSPLLVGRTLDSIPIKSPKNLKNSKYKINKILLAISSISNSKRNKIFNEYKILNIPILTVPSIEDIVSKKIELNTKKPILIEDLLGRDKVLPDPILLSDGITGKNIFITGAGGSIGSELCHQLIKLNPSKLILVELSEHSLFKIEKELNVYKNKNTSIHSYLGNASEEIFISKIFNKYKIDIVFHAAAYKHVPIVELNPLTGIKNNVFTTKTICKAAKEMDIPKVILISTDKAVRPTNIMGASKRLAEQILQAYAKEISKTNPKNRAKTKFSMVRFGNVLNSSGSVIPIFKEQISKGGPITITHPEINRYFMTIEEASQLVIQAAKLSKGGDLFVLDMGKPIKIIDLAKQMVTLSGLTIKDQKNPKGDLEIKFTGLRPGEKLYEELLIDAECLETSHPLIFRAMEKFIEPRDLWEKLNKLETEVNEYKLKSSIKLLSELVPEWKMK